MGYNLHLLSDGSECVPYPLAALPFYAGQGQLSEYTGSGALCHWHDDLEFICVLEQRMDYTVNGELIRLEAGQGIFVNARQFHGSLSVDGSSCRYLCVLFHPSLLSGNERLTDALRALCENAAYPYLPLRPDIPWQAEVLSRIRDICARFHPAADADLLGCMAQALMMTEALIHHMSPTPAQNPEERRVTALREMLGFICTHYTAPIRLEELAAAGHTSVSTCCALFRKHLRVSPNEYLIRYRLRLGAERLRNPDLTITEIALSVGFSGPCYFAECFRKRLGMTPSQYRNILRKEGI